MRRGDYDEFHESLATPITQDDTAYWSIGSIVTAIAGTLNTLLVIRFLVHLFSSDISVGLVAITHTLTNWLTQPFSELLGLASPTGASYIDWAALVAVVAVSIVATMIVRLVRAARV